MKILNSGNYKKTITSGFIMSLLMGFVGCSTTGGKGGMGANPFKEQDQVEEFAESNPAGLKILFFGHVAGESQPCGCGMNPKGGLDRRLAYVRRHQKSLTKDQYLLKLDAGNSLFPSEILHNAQLGRLKVKAEEILKAHKLMGVEIQNVGFLDLAAGLGFLQDLGKKTGTQFVSLNIIDPKTQKPIFLDHKKWSSDVFGEVIVVGLSAGAKRPSKDFSILDPEATLLKFMSGLSPESKLIVLSDLGQDADLALAQKLSRPVLFIGSRDPYSLEIPLPAGKSLIVRSQFQGQQWGDLLIHGKGQWNERWYGYGMGRSFSDLWEARKASYGQLASGPASKEKNDELEKLRAVQKDLEIYGHGDWKKANLYKHKLVDLTDAYLEKNELTEVVKKLK